MPYEPSQLELEGKDILQNEIDGLVENGHTVDDAHQILHKEMEEAKRNWELEWEEEEDWPFLDEYDDLDF